MPCPRSRKNAQASDRAARGKGRQTISVQHINIEVDGRTIVSDDAASIAPPDLSIRAGDGGIVCRTVEEPSHHKRDDQRDIDTEHVGAKVGPVRLAVGRELQQFNHAAQHCEDDEKVR